MFDIIGWMGNIFFVLGAILMARKSILGFHYNIIGNISYLIVGIITWIPSLIVISIGLIITNMYGICNWGKKKKCNCRGKVEWIGEHPEYTKEREIKYKHNPPKSKPSYKLALFLNALKEDAKNNPEKLYASKEVWDKEWDELIKGVTADKSKEQTKKCKEVVPFYKGQSVLDSELE